MNRIGVVGAGTMGHGIAQIAAMAGYRVRLTDQSNEALENGLMKVRTSLEDGVAKGKVTPDQRHRALSNLEGVADVASVARNADLVIEAIPEQLNLKRDLFSRMQKVAPDTCLFATNTSSISIAKIATAVRDPSRVIGTHFFNPVHLIKLLEVVITDNTHPDTVEAVRAFGVKLEKEVIVVRDFPGFATSRLGVALGMEAIRMVEQGVASAEDIDRAMVLGYKHPMGPLKLTDIVGLDIRMHIGEYLARELNNPAFEPPQLLRKMVAKGLLGKKSGEGFYKW